MNAKLIGLYGVCAAAFFALDFVWLSLSTERVYRAYLGDLLAPKPKLPVAAGFYLVYVAGLIALAVMPALRGGSVMGALWRGAVLGLLAYSTYDLTNLATIRDWPWQISAIDIAWGTTLNSVVAVVGFYAGRWLGLGG